MNYLCTVIGVGEKEFRLMVIMPEVALGKFFSIERDSSTEAMQLYHEYYFKQNPETGNYTIYRVPKRESDESSD